MNLEEVEYGPTSCGLAWMGGDGEEIERNPTADVLVRLFWRVAALEATLADHGIQLPDHQFPGDL